jgi:hypothetical protein
MCDTEQEIFRIEYPFGTLIVDEDIYYRIVKDENKRPYHKLKTIRGISFLYKMVRCRIGSDKTYSLTRMLMQAGENELVDHRNRNPLDNRRSNLRIVSSRQNAINRTPNSSTGYIGVSITTLRGKKRLQATFKPAGKRRKFSLYDTPENRIICALVHDKFVIEAGDDEYAPLNWPKLRDEPFRGELLKMDISEFRTSSLEAIADRLGIRGCAVKEHGLILLKITPFAIRIVS